jgi:nucleoid-associated protein YgaU
MTKDAKLGLVIGIGLVIVIAVVFFRKDATAAKAAGEPTAAAVKPKGISVAQGEARGATTTAVKHTVANGDTLFNLAERYYHDSGRFVDIYQANRDVLQNPQQLPAGIVIVIPGIDHP